MGDQWDPSQVVCYKCFGMGHYSRGCAYRGRGGNPKPSRVWSQGQTLDPRKTIYTLNQRKGNRKSSCKEVNLNIKGHFSGSNGGSSNKVGEWSVVGLHNTKIDGQAVLSPLTTPDSSNEHGDNGTTHGINKGIQDQETKRYKSKQGK